MHKYMNTNIHVSVGIYKQNHDIVITNKYLAIKTYIYLFIHWICMNIWTHRHVNVLTCGYLTKLKSIQIYK